MEVIVLYNLFFLVAFSAFIDLPAAPNQRTLFVKFIVATLLLYYVEWIVIGCVFDECKIDLEAGLRPPRHKVNRRPE